MERERELAESRKKTWAAMSKAQQREAVRKLLALPEKVPAAKKKVVSEEKRDGILVEKVVFETEPALRLVMAQLEMDIKLSIHELLKWRYLSDAGPVIFPPPPGIIAPVTGTYGLAGKASSQGFDWRQAMGK